MSKWTAPVKETGKKWLCETDSRNW